MPTISCFNYDAVGFLKLRLLTVVLGLGVSSVIRAQVSLDSPKVVIDGVDLQGAIHLPESVKDQLVASLMRRDYEENSNWIGDLENLVSSAETDGWPDRENEGYMGFSVGARWKPIRRDPGRLHVSVTILVDEGQQKRLKAITFRYLGARPALPVLDSTDLRKLILLNDGEVYNRDKLYAGLDAVYRAYNERGFIGLTSNIEMQSDDTNQTVAVFVELNIGQQYRWENIQVIGLDPKTETLLKSQLKTGSPVNPKVIADFYRENKPLLPVGVSPESVKWQHHPERATVDLTFDFRTSVSP
jgi:outer membrane protein assembly factor BamA